MTELRIRHATDEDLDSILDLVALSLGEGVVPRSREYWRWKHERNPFGPSPCLVAEADGTLVGLRAFMRWRWHAEGSCWPAVRAVDTATHPDWRGRGIFRQLTLALVDEVSREGAAFVYNTPNDQSRPGYLKMGWQRVGRVTLLVRPLGVRGLAAAARHALGRRLPPRSAGNTDEDPTSGTDSPSGRSAEELLAHPGVQEFLDALPDRRGRLSTLRKVDYLRWRYGSVPGFDYRTLWRFEGSAGAAVIFRRKVSGGLKELRMCEILVGEGRISRRLGREVLPSVLDDTDAHAATAMAVPGTPGYRLLLRSGFLPVPRVGPVLTVRRLGSLSNGIDPARRSRWDLSIGDVELF